jgi:hypothetical protein
MSDRAIHRSSSTCNGYLPYSQVAIRETFMPIERLRFQSEFFSGL